MNPGISGITQTARSYVIWAERASVATKTKRTTLRNKCDKLFSIFIRARDKVCVACGSARNLQCAHVFSRRYLKVRWDERNAVALCAGCHVKFTHFPLEWEDFIIERMGQDEYTQLRADARETSYKVDYEATLEDLLSKQPV